MSSIFQYFKWYRRWTLKQNSKKKTVYGSFLLSVHKAVSGHINLINVIGTVYRPGMDNITNTVRKIK